MSDKKILYSCQLLNLSTFDTAICVIYKAKYEAPNENQTPYSDLLFKLTNHYTM